MPQSRFRELWMTGKVAIDRKTKEEQGERAVKEAAAAMKGLIPEASERLYTDLQSRRGTETGHWLKGLVTETPKAAPGLTQSPASGADAFEEGRTWIDTLFHQFAELALTFNEHAVGTDLSIECERPKLIETRDEKIWYRPITGRSYQGRISTRLWSEVVRGDEKKIVFYIFPAEMTIGFKSGQYTDDDVPPFMVIERTGNAWTIQGEGVPLSKVPPLAKELFGDLIRVTSGKMTDEELFKSHQTTSPKLGENVAVGYDPNASTQPRIKIDASDLLGQPPAAVPAMTPSTATAPAQAPASSAHTNTDALDIPDACDIVDKVIDKELKRLYAESAKYGPAAPESAEARKQISAIQSFRMRVVDAFEQYAHDAQAAAPKQGVAAGKSP